MLDTHAIFQAEDAILKMEKILIDYPKAAMLAREVGTFFGPDFYLKGTSDPHSQFFIGNERTWKPETEPVEIRLVCSPRYAAALTHELLHGKLLMEGYPWSWVREGQIGHECLPNIVYHELMVNQYRELGLPEADFIGQFDTQKPPQEYDPSKLQICWEWLNSWLDGRYTGIQKRIEAAGQIRADHSLYENTFQKMEAWYNALCLVAPEKFEDEYDELSRIMELQVIGREQWFRLERGATYPIVVPNT